MYMYETVLICRAFIDKMFNSFVKDRIYVYILYNMKKWKEKKNENHLKQ